MFEDQTAVQHLATDSGFHVTEPLSIREIIKRCSELPHEVKKAKFTQVVKRLIEKNLLARLTNRLSVESNAVESIDRLQSRRDALSPYLGSHLVCVFIRLPGVHYTIEIDPIKMIIVYWEWQST